MESLLHQALVSHDLLGLASLLRAGADPDEPDPRTGCRPLHTAIYELDFGGQIEAIRILLAAGANADMHETGVAHTTPLIAAIRDGQRHVAIGLLSHGASPNICDGFGESALRLAVANKDMELARELLLHGATATINEAGGPLGRTALGHATANIDVPMVDLLLRNGADRESMDVDYQKAHRHLPARDERNDADWVRVDRLLTPPAPDQ